MMAQMTQSPLGKPVDGPSPWWTPARHADVRAFLAARSALEAIAADPASASTLLVPWQRQLLDLPE